MAVCTALVCRAQCSMPVKLGHYQSPASRVCSEMTAMIRQICNVKPQDTANIRSTELLAWRGIEDLDLILKERRLHWYGQVERSKGAVKTAFDIEIVGKHGPGRPKMTWKQLTEKDCREWKFSAIYPQNRDTWRSGVRSAMHAASQLH